MKHDEHFKVLKAIVMLRLLSQANSAGQFLLAATLCLAYHFWFTKPNKENQKRKNPTNKKKGK
jgi:hypothetical protein